MQARITLILALLFSPTALAWSDLAPGLSYQRLKKDAIQAFKIDLKKIRLQIVQASDKGRSNLTTAEFKKESDVLLAVNGGFFTKEWRPLGLLVSQSKKLNPLRRADWGVLTVTKAGRAKLVHTRDWNTKNAPDFAIQAGPRLVVNGRLLPLKAQVARRTAIGFPAGGRSIILVVANTPTSLLSLAHLLKDKFNCNYAINLDGGSSTQLWSRYPEVTAVGGFPVTNAVILVARP